MHVAKHHSTGKQKTKIKQLMSTKIKSLNEEQVLKFQDQIRTAIVDE